MLLVEFEWGSVRVVCLVLTGRGTHSQKETRHRALAATIEVGARLSLAHSKHATKKALTALGDTAHGPRDHIDFGPSTTTTRYIEVLLSSFCTT